MGVTHCRLGLLSTRCFFSCNVKDSNIHIYVVMFGKFTIMMERDYEYKLNTSVRLFPNN